MSTIGFQKDEKAKLDVEFSDPQVARDQATIGSNKLRIAVANLNAALSSGTLKAPILDVPLANKIAGTIPPADILFNDYTGKSESTIVIKLDKTELWPIVIPVTPANVEKVVDALGAAKEAVQKTKGAISPSNPVTINQVSEAANSALRRDLRQFTSTR